MDQRRAIIDIGSNTVRLVIFGGPPRAPVVLVNEKVTARLGRNLGETGLLSPRAISVALAALGRFATLLRLEGISRVDTVATAATRDAANGGLFLDSVRALGLSPRLLSGEDEARASALGVIGAFPEARGMVADLGGGSLELVRVAYGAAGYGISLPFGTLRLPALRAVGPAKFNRRLAKAIKVAGMEGGANGTLFLVGGSHRAFARFVMHRAGVPLDDPHGLVMANEAALAACRAVLRSQPLLPVPGVASGRLVSLPDTAAQLAALVRALKPDALAFSSWGLREGLLYQSLPSRVRAEDPLVAGTLAFARNMGVSDTLVRQVDSWIAAIAPARHASLRIAAVALALASQRVEPNMRSGEAASWALHKRWIGLDAQGRAMLAAAVLANAGQQPDQIALARIAPAEALAEAAIWGAALRLCRRFSGLAGKALTTSALTIEGESLVLRVDAPVAALYTDPVRRELGALAARLGLSPEPRVAGKGAKAPQSKAE